MDSAPQTIKGLSDSMQTGCRAAHSRVATGTVVAISEVSLE